MAMRLRSGTFFWLLNCEKPAIILHWEQKSKQNACVWRHYQVNCVQKVSKKIQQDKDDFLMSWPPWPKKAKTWSRQVGLSSDFSQTICWWVSSNACICNLISGITVKLSQISARRCFAWSEQLDLKSIMPKNQKRKTHVAAEHTSYHLYWSTTDFGAKFYIGGRPWVTILPWDMVYWLYSDFNRFNKEIIRANPAEG